LNRGWTRINADGEKTPASIWKIRVLSMFRGSAGVPPAEEEEESRGGWMAGEMAGILPASGTATGPP
jgi:hypothetical protein